MSTLATGVNTRPTSWKVWLLASRPATLTAALGPVLVGSAVALQEGVANLSIAFAAAIGAMFIQIGTNLYNDYADFEKGADTEQRIGPDRATQRGWLTPGQTLRGAWVSFAVATAAGCFLLATSGWPVIVIGVCSIVCGIAYTGGPRPLAYVGLGDIFVFIFFGLVAVVGTYFVQAHAVSPVSFAAAIPIGLLATAVLVVNNLRDRFTDATCGKRTLAVRYGARFARAEYATLMIGAYISLAVTAALGLHSFTWLTAWLSLPLAIARIRSVLRNDGASLNPELGRTAQLGLVFSGLLVAGILL